MPIFENYPVTTRIQAWSPDEGVSMHPTFLQVVGGGRGGGGQQRAHLNTPGWRPNLAVR